MRSAAGLVFLMALAGQASAHPHVFIDAGLEFQFDAEGRAVALRVVWAYDDLTSLLIVEDRGLDKDGDGALDATETDALSGFDMNWDADFVGDTYVLLGDVPVTLGPPGDWTATYTNGRVISTHLRKLDPPVRPADLPLVVQVYDPGFYSAYTIASEPVLRDAIGCAAQVFAPDIEAAQVQLDAALAEFTGDIESDFPAVGALYAEEVRVTCTAAP
ncbi:MAG: DUF1007 family protein [Gemmobacter sp.]|nr:DUF1007 family protein [Gemmobacter sp.]